MKYSDLVEKYAARQEIIAQQNAQRFLRITTLRQKLKSIKNGEKG